MGGRRRRAGGTEPPRVPWSGGIKGWGLRRCLRTVPRRPRIGPDMSAEAQPGRDERRGRRVPVDLEATFGGRQKHPARVADLSLVGCLVRTGASLAARAVVDVSIELPDGRPLRTKARVVEVSVDGDSLPGPSRGFLVGLEFLALPASDELRLRAFLDREGKRRRGANSPPA
jgi:PilZ domain